MKTKKESLFDALTWASLRDLPPKAEGDRVYIFALALVSKKDGSSGYVAIKKDRKFKDAIIKDFGSQSPIISIDEIYPYLYLDKRYVPKFNWDKKGTREEVIEWIERNTFENNVESLTDDELKDLVYKASMERQLAE